eukprot:623153-Ditylum_brightwellii.AAC.1
MSSRSSRVNHWRASLIWWKCCLGARHCNIGGKSSLRQQVYLFWEFLIRMTNTVVERRKKTEKKRKRARDRVLQLQSLQLE